MLQDSEDAGEFTAPRDPVGVTASAVKPAIDFESHGYRDMIGRSLLNKGKNVRLKRAIEKAKNGEPVVIAYIGLHYSRCWCNTYSSPKLRLSVV